MNSRDYTYVTYPALLTQQAFASVMRSFLFCTVSKLVAYACEGRGLQGENATRTTPPSTSSCSRRGLGGTPAFNSLKCQEVKRLKDGVEAAAVHCRTEDTSVRIDQSSPYKIFDRVTVVIDRIWAYSTKIRDATLWLKTSSLSFCSRLVVSS